VRGARLHNLRGVDARIPLATFTVVTGVSGSGKSTLVHDVLYRNLERCLRGGHTAKEHLGEVVGAIAALDGWRALADVVLIDQAPIGRTPRSNPVTYVKGFDDLRALYAAQPLARERRYTPSTFSFNVAGGRCEACEGAGHVLVEMVFLANVYVPCEQCDARRFRREVLDVKVEGRSIHDALELTVSARWSGSVPALPARARGTCSRSASATSASASRRRRCPAARPSASRSRASWPRPPGAPDGAAVASSMSSTSPRPACTSTTSAPCAACSTAWWTRAIRCSSSSTTST
jgi:hypothetical protein